jgi:hypothetical protein
VRKFDAPFDSYEIGELSPITIELEKKAGAGRYLALLSNPLYYFYAFQYVGGSLYRAMWGYETFWDRKLDEKFVRTLDIVLNRYSERREYYFEEIEFTSFCKLKGQPWQRQVKPDPLNVFITETIYIPRGTRALARINRLDSPKHVDIEVNDPSQVISSAYFHYHDLKDRGVIKVLNRKKKTYEKHGPNPDDSKPTGTASTKAKSGQSYAVEGTGKNVPTARLPFDVSYLQKRLQRFASLRKA